MTAAAPERREGMVIDADDRALFDRIIAPAAPQSKHGMVVNEGYRFISLGESGSGKTTLMRCVVYYTIIQRFARFALVHDTKGIFPEYPRSLQVSSTRQFVSGGGFKSWKGIPVVSFRGNPRRDEEVSAEEVAQLSLAFARQGVMIDGKWTMNPHVCVIEEISEAATAGRKNLKSKGVLKLAEQGRKMGVSLVATTQTPKNMPDDLRNQAESISFGRLTGTTINYLEQRMDLDPAMVRAIRGAQGEGLPNHTFVLYIKGQPWDGKVHKLHPRTVKAFE